jgi:hypothetical protein
LVELTDKDQDFWESQELETPEGRDQMSALQNGLMEVLPNETKLSPARRSLFFPKATPRPSSQRQSLL